MARQKDASQKEINLAQEIYIHYNKENYLAYKQKYVRIDTDPAIISNIYRADARTIRNRMNVLNKITNKDGNTVADVLGIINDIAGNTDTLSKMEKKIVVDTAELIRAGKRKTFQASKMITSAKDIGEEVAALDEYLGYVKEVVNSYNVNSQEYLQYVLDKNKSNHNTISNMQSVFGDKGMDLLAVNKSAATSFKTLVNRMEMLDQISKQLHAGKKPGKVKDSKGKMVSYQSLIWPMHWLFTNILGGLGEGVGVVYAVEKLMDFLKEADGKYSNITVASTGTERVDGWATKKSDYTITVNAKDGSILLSFGISAKAQTAKSSKPIITTFETTQLENLLNKYVQATHAEQYVFYNSLYHNLNSSEEMRYLSRLYAARALIYAITGSLQGENVLFVQYLDSLIRLDDFFDLLSQANIGMLPRVVVSGASKIKKENRYVRQTKGSQTPEGIIDLTPTQKSIAAWIRSRDAIKKMNNLSTQIRYEHNS